MRRSTGLSAFFSPLRAGLAGAVALATILSCSDSVAPKNFNDGVVAIEDFVPDSLKQASLAQALGTLLAAPVTASADILVAPGARFYGTVVGAGYSVSPVQFAPESAPTLKPDTVYDDGWLPDVNLGFSFYFYGKEYSQVNIYSNGFLLFGQGILDPLKLGFNKGGPIPNAKIPNNIIAFAWMDLRPDLVKGGGVRWERRGIAPNRRFIVQFTNVPEYTRFGTPAYVTSQIVLTEGANDITIYTSTLGTNTLGMTITQGIENSDGTKAAWADPALNPSTNALVSRVQNNYRLTNDAVRFSPPGPPVVSAPPSIVVPTTPPTLISVPSTGTCDAIVNPGVATATDDGTIESIVGVRSDDPALALDAPYQKGVTTITWTATDADGMKGSGTQTVTVVDQEKPLITAPADQTADNDPGLPSAVVAAGTATAKDNCPEVQVSSARSDGAASDAPFMVGITKITWTAADPSGNTTTAVQSITVKDVEAPSITAPADYWVNATSPSGAVVYFSLESHDNVAVTSLVCTPWSGSTLPIGSNPISCTASDAAGNKNSATFVVSVISAPMQTMNLITFIKDLGLSDGVANPLINQLRAALDGANSCKKLSDFIDLLLLKGGDLTNEEKSAIIAEVKRIMNVMNCPTAAETRAKPQLISPNPSGY